MLEGTGGSAARVVYDGIIFRLQGSRGISRYFREIVLRTARVRPVTLLSYGEGNLFEPTGADGDGLTLERRRPRPFERVLDADIGADLDPGAIFHSSYYRGCTAAVPEVVTVHDVANADLGGGARARAQVWQLLRAVERASAIICISRATADSLHQLRPAIPAERLHVVYHGVSSSFFEPDPEALRLAPNWPYALFVGNRHGYKNFDAAFAALAHVGGLGAVIVGGEPASLAEEAAWASALGGRIRVLRDVGEGELAALYRGADCLLYPSQYEGFGMPVLEAMASGCPVIAVARTAIPEVAGDAALLVDRGEVSEFEEALRAVAHPGRRSELIEAGRARAALFGWERCAKETDDVYRSVGQAAN